MSDDRLLREIRDKIQHVMYRPSMYGTLEEAESFIMGLLGVAVSLETGEDLRSCQKRVYATIRQLTKDVPGNAEWARHLCDERLTPERTTSSELFTRRTGCLCAELLATWDDEFDETTHPSLSEEERSKRFVEKFYPEKSFRVWNNAD